MGRRCAAACCKEEVTKDSPHSFHKFPTETKRRQQWALKVNRETRNEKGNRVLWQPADHDLLCSKHFLESSFTDRTILSRKMNIPYMPHLREDAVPTIFLHSYAKRKKEEEYAAKRSAVAEKKRKTEVLNQLLVDLKPPEPEEDLDTDIPDVYDTVNPSPARASSQLQVNMQTAVKHESVVSDIAELLSRKPPCVSVAVSTVPPIKRHCGVQVPKVYGPHKRNKAISVNMPCGCAGRRVRRRVTRCVTAASIAVQCDIWSDRPSPSLMIKEESPDQVDVMAPDKQMPNVYPACQRVLRKEKLQHDLCMKIEIPFHDFDECEEKKEESEPCKGSSKDSAPTMSPAHDVAKDNGCEESTLIDSSSDNCSERNKLKLEEDNGTFSLLRMEVFSEGHGSNTQPCRNIGNKGNHSTDSNGTFTQSCVLKEEESVATGVKPYKCRFCAKVFSRLVTLKTHQYRCPENRPYKCKECNKSFAHKSTLKMHQLIHT